MNEHKKLLDIVEDFDTAMMVTSHPNHGLDARPMAIAEMDEAGSLWFVSSKHSGKMIDIKEDAHSAITLQSSSKYVSISGVVRVVNDRAKVEQLWNEAWKVWFPEGKSDPSIVLLQFLPQHGEYWDNSGFKGVKYMVQAGKAYLQGDTPQPDKDQHARVSM